MAKEDNLTSWKPGQSGNPAGKPKGTKNRATVLQKFLDLPIASVKAFEKHSTGLPEGATIEDAIGIALLREASKGDVSAIKEVSDTLHGKITEKIDNTHSFAQMGRVKLSNVEAGKSIELSFDVGSEPVKLPENQE